MAFVFYNNLSNFLIFLFFFYYIGYSVIILVRITGGTIMGENETLSFFRREIEEVAKLPETIRQIARDSVWDIIDQRFLSTLDDNRGLAHFALNWIPEFEFNKTLISLYRTLDGVFGETFARVRRTIDNPYIILDYETLTNELIEQLQRLKDLDYGLDRDFRSLANHISSRYGIQQEKLSFYLRERQRKIEGEISKRTNDILDTLIQRTPDLFRELKAGAEREKKKRIKLEIYTTRDRKHYLTAESAKVLGLPCNDRYLEISGAEYERLEKEYRVVIKRVDKMDTRVNDNSGNNSQTSQAGAESKTERGSTSITSAVVFFDEDHNYYISNDVALAFGFTDKKADDLFLLSRDQFSIIVCRTFIDFKSIKGKTKQVKESIKEEVVVYNDNEGNKYVKKEVAQKLGFPLHTFNDYHILSEEELDVLNTKFIITEEDVLMIKDFADERVETRSTQETAPVDEPVTRPVMMIYVGPDGRLYKQVPMVVDKVDVAKLETDLTPAEMIDFMEYADIVWVKFDGAGVLSDVPNSEIDAIVNYYLGSVGAITEVSNANNVHRYKVGAVVAPTTNLDDKVI